MFASRFEAAQASANFLAKAALQVLAPEARLGKVDELVGIAEVNLRGPDSAQLVQEINGLFYFYFEHRPDLFAQILVR